jgi:hypothetical protein
VAGAPGQTWVAVDAALRAGCRGLPGGETLCGLLCRARGQPGSNGRPASFRLTVAQILAWADAHKEQAGDWPKATSGPIPGAAALTWAAVEAALRAGWRGLPGGDSLAALLRRERGLRERRGCPKIADRGQVARLLARGLAQVEIARRLGVSPQRVSQLARYEGKSHPP